MKTYPLNSISVENAKEMQFKLIDATTKNFTGNEILTNGDVGVTLEHNKPRVTLKVEKTIADFFGEEAAVLVRGAGTAAIRWGLISMMNNADTILVHDAPIYPTSKVTIETFGLKVVKVDFNNKEAVLHALKNNKIHGMLIQYTRQKIDDRYEIGEVINTIKEFDQNIPIITDDNYAVMKVEKTGAELGADLSAFSCFKLLGPEGVGCVVGKKKFIDKIVKLNYSGGSQVQGKEAMEALRGMTYAPVALAIQAEVSEKVLNEINNNEYDGIKKAYMANAQSKVILVEFTEDIAKEVLIQSEKLGAAPYPVGSESKYEFVPMFYRVSGTFRKADPSLENRMIRINPMRSGSETILNILKNAIENVYRAR